LIRSESFGVGCVKVVYGQFVLQNTDADNLLEESSLTIKQKANHKIATRHQNFQKGEAIDGESLELNVCC
jgi:hypothetical protein